MRFLKMLAEGIHLPLALFIAPVVVSVLLAMTGCGEGGLLANEGNEAGPWPVEGQLSWSTPREPAGTYVIDVVLVGFESQSFHFEVGANDSNTETLLFSVDPRSDPYTIQATMSSASGGFAPLRKEVRFLMGFDARVTPSRPRIELDGR